MDTVLINRDFDLIESAYCSAIAADHRKKHAQFFTPYEIAKFLGSYILNAKREIKEVLEPALGLGIFSRVLRSELDYQNEIRAFEIDNRIIEFGRTVHASTGIKLITGDYLGHWGLNPDCIICNPPYLKFHDYDNLSAVKAINEKIGTNLTGFTNLYTLFILKSLSELPANGRAAYIVPSEFFNADYGVAVKRKLIEMKMLKHIINFHFEKNVFDDALTTSSLLLFENSTDNANVDFYNINSIDELGSIDSIINDNKPAGDHVHKFSYTLSELDPSLKWRNYYQDRVIHRSQKLVNLKTFCKVSRGIATGANDYFSFNHSKAKTHNIKQENLLNCICKSADVEKLFFSQDDFEQLARSDKKVFLVDLRISPDVYTREYVKFGEAEGIDKKFLTRNRKPWYAIENKKPADIWVGVFSRDGLKFIQNNSDALNLTTFHGIYIHPAYQIFKDLLFAYLLTDLSKEIFSANRREYGNGLSKFEPNDFNNCDVFDFRTLSGDDIAQLNEIIDNLKESQQDPLETDANIEGLDEYFRGLL